MSKLSRVSRFQRDLMGLESCLFCKIVAGKEKSWVVYRDSQVMALLDVYPLTRGHTLIIPIRHYESMLDIPYPLLRRIMSLAKKLCISYERALKIQGVSIGVLNHCLKTPAHRHFHLAVVPRYNMNDKRDPANVKPSQTFPRESDANLDRILGVIRREMPTVNNKTNLG
jgi:histidine triad (HIT) family protein